MQNQRQQLGQSGEERATQFLLQKGYRILARNLKSQYGEVDIVALDGPTLVIIEVKTKQSLAFGLPAEMVTRAKQQKLRLLARQLALANQKVNYRIDVIAIDWSGSQPVIDHFQSAV